MTWLVVLLEVEGVRVRAMSHLKTIKKHKHVPVKYIKQYINSEGVDVATRSITIIILPRNQPRLPRPSVRQRNGGDDSEANQRSSDWLITSPPRNVA